MKEELLRKYETHLVKMGKSANTVAAYLRDAQAFEAFLEKKNKETAGITQTVVVSYVLGLKKSGSSPSTINRRVSSLRTYFEFLKDGGVLEENPAKGLKLPRTPRKAPEFLTTEEMERLLQAPDANRLGCMRLRDRALIELMYATGIRASEVVDLKISDVNLKIGFVICAAGEKSRMVPLGKPAKKAVSTYIKEGRYQLLGETDSEALFLNTHGEALTRQGLWRILKANAEKAGITKDMTPQLLRNTFAVHMLQNGADLRSLQEMMGHAEISATEVYLEALKVHIKDVYEKAHPRA